MPAAHIIRRVTERIEELNPPDDLEERIQAQLTQPEEEAEEEDE